ncbi:substrate-binding domain-containing protein [Geobacter pelophilus]|uniref:Substrate-binding domain-containing protein n=1 Tax=Geoanaerobacter pelophilus TaxID=60036 RepID=A0AAW4L2U0_9BACT|nr:substrate-binding domain-containing protein [Geoanaerobacter pelophilus]MBT0665296.1 substrate-binding domain-containing protein [Geoanaerobacter pelophilus]
MKRMLKPFAIGAALFALCSGSCLAEEIKISAGGAPADSIIKPITAPFEKATGDKINLIFGGATISFKVFDRGDSEVVFAGSSFDDLLAALKKENYEVKDKSVYHVETIGKSQIYVAINKDNPVKALTKEQIKGIYTGKIQNWKEVGGNDDAIMAIISTQNPATMGAFKKMALDGADYLKDNLDVPTYPEITNTIAANPNAIGFGPYSLSAQGNKIPQMPEFVRPVVAVTKGSPSAKIKRLLDFIKGDGQKYVKP